jgi:thiamine biosynthesis protein ThiI
MTIQADLDYNAILCRYSEIGLKGKNRAVFEQCLARNLMRRFARLGPVTAHRDRGRIFLLPKHGQVLGNQAVEELRQAARQVFGLSSISPVFRVKPEMTAITETIDRTFPAVYAKLLAHHADDHEPIRYAMRCRRNYPDFPLKSKDIEILFADELIPRYSRLKVDLDNPELLVRVEIRREHAFISYEDIPGPGGLPTGTGGRTVTLLSGGIDSPVASYQIMKRGCTTDFITFHSSPYTPPATLRKVAGLAQLLNQFQGGEGVLYTVNLLECQKHIRDVCDERLRTLLYRRMMMRVATAIAASRGAAAIVTGENLGQVASQTLANLTVIARATEMEVLRPILANDKQETVAMATRIGSFALSREEVPDSCTVFAPQRPATRANVGRVVAEESKLDMAELLRATLASVTILDPLTFAERPAGLPRDA